MRRDEERHTDSLALFPGAALVPFENFGCSQHLKAPRRRKRIKTSDKGHSSATSSSPLFLVLYSNRTLSRLCLKFWLALATPARKCETLVSMLQRLALHR